MEAVVEVRTHGHLPLCSGVFVPGASVVQDTESDPVTAVKTNWRQQNHGVFADWMSPGVQQPLLKSQLFTQVFSSKIKVHLSYGGVLTVTRRSINLHISFICFKHLMKWSSFSLTFCFTLKCLVEHGESSEDQALHSFLPSLTVVCRNVGIITRMPQVKICNITSPEVRFKPQDKTQNVRKRARTRTGWRPLPQNHRGPSRTTTTGSCPALIQRACCRSGWCCLSVYHTFFHISQNTFGSSFW